MLKYRCVKTDVSVHARIRKHGYEGHNPWHTVSLKPLLPLDIECVTNLEQESEMIIFESNLTTLEASIILVASVTVLKMG